MNKVYISANSLLTDSFQLALDIFESGYRPDVIVGVWRGGAPVGIAVQEMLAYLGAKTDHIAIRSSSYAGIGQRSKDVQVYGLDYLQATASAGQHLLLVDDVFDTGLSLQKIIHELQLRCGSNMPVIRIATPYYKPANNQSMIRPDYYLHTSEDWLVFPHELNDLELADLIQHKQELQPLQARLARLLEN